MSVATEGKSVFCVKGEDSHLRIEWGDESKNHSGAFFYKFLCRLKEDNNAVYLTLFLIVFPMISILFFVGANLGYYLTESLTVSTDFADAVSIIFAHLTAIVPTFMLSSRIKLLADRYEDSIRQFTHVKLGDEVTHSLEKELNIHDGEELAVHIHYALTETPYKDKMAAALLGFREVKELEIEDEKQLEESNMQVLSLVIEVLKIVNAYKLEIKKAQELEEEQKRKELAEKELREKEEKDFLVSQTLRNVELEFDAL